MGTSKNRLFIEKRAVNQTFCGVISISAAHSATPLVSGCFFLQPDPGEIDLYVGSIE